MESPSEQNDLSQKVVNDKSLNVIQKDTTLQSDIIINDESQNKNNQEEGTCEIEENGLSHNEDKSNPCSAEAAENIVDDSTASVLEDNTTVLEETSNSDEALLKEKPNEEDNAENTEPSKNSADVENSEENKTKDTDKSDEEVAKSDKENSLTTAEDSFQIVDEDNSQIVDEETSQIADEETSQNTDKESSEIVDEESSQNLDEENSQLVDKDSSPIVIEETSQIADEESSQITNEETSQIADEDSPQVVDEESTTQVIDDEKEKDTTDLDKSKTSDDITEKDDTQKNDQVSCDEIDKTNKNINNEVLANANSIEGTSDEVNCNENPVFVHVNTENEKDNDKSINNDQGNEEPQEDPIASDCFPPTEEDDSKDAEQGADEELCIIPDTERVISQEEREAASSMIPLRSLPDTNADATEVVSNHETESDQQKGKYVISKYTDEMLQECVQCLVSRKANYVAILDKKSVYICDDNCLNSFKEENPGKFISNVASDIRVKNMANDSSFLSKIDFTRNCAECKAIVEINNDSTLSWETLDFCGELCLGKYQKSIGGSCCTCKAEVRINCLGKYCVRFGNDIKQFCSSNCLDGYKKNLKICSLCQKNITQDGGFLAPVGDKGQFKDFCTEACMDKYNQMASSKVPEAKEGVKCSVCLHENPITIEYEHDKKNHLICSLPCLIAFKFVNKITPGKCDKCLQYFDIKVLEKNCMYFEDSQRTFCSKTCQNLFLNSIRRIVPCSWCKVKKYNFDMIRRSNNTGQVLMMCSLNCLSLYQVSVNAVNSKKICCDQCLRNLKPLYHLTMSDATLRNFCSYDCVMSFQNQFSKTPITFGDQPDSPVPTGQPKRAKRNVRTESDSTPPTTASYPSLPVISNVQSLAATTNGTVTTRSAKSKPTANVNNNSSPIPAKSQIKQQLIIKPAPLPQQRNVATMCTVGQESKGVDAKPTTESVEIQTNDLKNNTIVIPIPVPIFVPTPVHMFSTPFPMPFPFVLPVPVPIFIPTTRNSANGIMKEIKKIQVKIPTDPFEAELLMMAEMVAGDKKEENTDSESEEEEAGGPPDEGTFSPEPVDASNTFGDDMLQMALKMATELDEPAVDLEGALTANTITASQSGETSGNEEAVDDPQPMNQIIERQGIRGRKRSIRQTRQYTNSKRGRRAAAQSDVPLMAPPQPPPPPEPIEKPDANMCLKYTFGVNAWKQWVTTKNAELEKSSRRVKLFKPEILQLTADELNYSLCLFVKEVRKPNGSEYAPDTIYYLCLGIQQYLFENGRIDNIFCDAYYEKFTDCLDEVVRKFSVLYNDSHYIVTRVEEEHLWESKQLGAHSPHVLLSTLMFFNTKHFNLTTVDEHMQLSFSHIMKHWKRNPNQPGTAKVPGSRNVLLRFYPPQSALEGNARKKKVYEQQENEENPLRCPVKLYEFYLSKCPESVKTRNDVFYLQPERSCVPDSPVWYSTMPLGRDALEKMLHRVKMVKEINVALLTS